MLNNLSERTRNTITFFYNNKLRIVKPIAVKQGRFSALLLAENILTGKIKSFKMNRIIALTSWEQSIFNGEVECPYLSHSEGRR